MPLSTIRIPPTVLPILTTAIGAGGLTVGIYSFINPTVAARIYGVPVSTSSATPTTILFTTPSSRAARDTANLQSRDHSYIHALGIRNLTTGLGIITLTAYWHFTLATSPREVRAAVQRALGIVILIGSLVPILDAWVCWTAGRDAGGAHARKRKAGEVNVGDVNSEAAEAGRKAGNLHAMRSVFWLAGALWCLLA